MCHFYANPLSVLIQSTTSALRRKLIQPEHYEAIRILPSFRKLVESLATRNNAKHARELLENDSALLDEVNQSIVSRAEKVTELLRAVYVLSVAAGSANIIDLYLKAFKGTFGHRARSA